MLLLSPCLVASWLESHWRSQARAAVDALEGEDMGLRLESLLSPEPKRNAAPALLKAFDALELTDEEDDQVSLELDRLDGEPNPDEVFAAQPDEDTLAQRQVTRASLARKIEEAVPLVDQALAADGLAFDVAWEEGLGADLDHLSPFKQLLLLLGLRARWAQEEGRAKDAWQDVERIARLIGMFREPMVISHLIRVAVIERLTEVIQDLLEAGAPPDAEAAARLTRRLQALDAPAQFTLALRGEMAAGLRMFDKLDSGDMSLSQFGELGAGETTDVDPSRKINVFARAFVMRERACYAELMADSVQRSTLRGAGLIKAMREWDAQAVERAPSHPLGVLLLAGLPRIAKKELESRAIVRMTRVALDLATRGEDLPTALPGKVPSDPFTDGQPLRWRRSGPRAGLLWSVGRDGEDDGGEKEPDDPTLADEPHDLVYEVRLP